MDIVFSSKKLQKIFNAKNELVREYGSDRAQHIMRRMVVLRAVETLSQVSRFPPERCHELVGEFKDCFSVDLKHPYRLLFKPIEPVPRKEDGGIDLQRVTTITILSIKDYH